MNLYPYPNGNESPLQLKCFTLQPHVNFSQSLEKKKDTIKRFFKVVYNNVIVEIQQDLWACMNFFQSEN